MTSNLKIGWVVPEDLSIASYRYRAMIPMREMTRAGVSVGFGLGETTVFQKHWFQDSPSVAAKLRKDGRRVVFDLSDDHLNDRHGDFYREMISLSDVVVCCSDYLASVVKKETGRDSVVISDPYAYPQRPPKRPGRNIMWHGHFTNIPALQSELKNLQDFNLLAVGDYDPGGGAKFMKWSQQGLMQGFAWAQAVIVPVNLDEKAKSKSPNRMVDAIRQGCYVVANSIPSYEGYGMWVGNIREGLDWMMKNQDEAYQSVIKAQEIVEKLHAPKVIGRQWMKALGVEGERMAA